MLALLIAATEEGGSHAPFYALGGALALFAVLVGALGISRRATFPPSDGAARAVMGLAALLVVAVCASAVITA